MNGEGADEFVSGSESSLDQIDAVCDRFEAAWKSGARPRLQDYLAEVGQRSRAGLFRELLRLELNYRRAAGEDPSEEEYRCAYPQHDEEVASVFALTPAPVAEPTVDLARPKRAEPRALQVRCPHCRGSIEIVDDTPLGDIVCTACGSKFSLVGDEALVQESIGGTRRRRQQFGHFELIEQLGSGGFGAVWKARDTQLDRIVALKIPRKGQLNREETELFLREARAAGQLRHPNIVSIHEVGIEDGTIYIVTDFVEGLSLSDHLTGPKFGYRDAAELCAKIADALHHAHENGVIHRDLKPSNIMIDRAGQPHLMDFGLAKRETGEVTMTAEGQILGTPAYMSPEQARGEGHRADRRTDVYSLGVILFELLTGERPFRGNFRMLIKQVSEEPPPRPRKLDNHIPRDLETICLKCLEKSPAGRYATAAELAEELRRYLRGEPIHARPISSTDRAWRWCRRNPWVAALSAGLLISLAGGTIVSSGLAWRAHNLAVDAAANADLANLSAKHAAASAAEARRGEAEAERQRDVARKEAEKAQRVSNFLVALFEASDPAGVQGYAFFTPGGRGEKITAKEILDRGVKRLNSDLKDQTTVRATVLDTIGNVCRTLGEFKQAEPLLTEALEIRKKLLAPDDLELAASLRNLAWLHHDLGRYAQADPLYQEALAICQRRGDSGQALDSLLLNIAWLRTQMGDFAQAEELFQQVVVLRRKRLGDHDRDVAIAWVGLAACYLDSGQTTKAIMPSLQARDAFLKSGDGTRLGEAVTAFQQGVILHYQFNKLAAAEDSLRRARGLTADMLGADHMYVALVLHELAYVLESRGKLDEAEKCYLECLAIARKTVSFGHPKAGIGVYHCARLLSQRGKKGEADALMKELLDAHRGRFGEGHPLLADAMVECAAVYSSRGDRDIAAGQLEQALAIYDRSGGDRHRMLVRCLCNLADHRIRRRDYSAAESLYQRALPLARRQYGGRHVNCAAVLDGLALARLRQGKIEGVEAQLNEAMALCPVPLIGVPPDELDEVLTDLGELYRKTGRLADAVAAAQRRNKLWPKDPDRLYQTACDLSLCAAQAQEADRQKYADQAMESLRRAVACGRKNAGRMAKDADLAPIRSREDFKKLLDGLKPPK